MMPTIKTPSSLADTDLCVMCGMCLPHCPTYQLYQTEAESPRGRIALMQSVGQGRIQGEPVALEHIDHCLGCLNCETMCPSRVPYGKLIDEFRHLYHSSITKPRISRQVLNAATKPGKLDSLARLAGHPVIRQLLNLGQHLFSTTPVPVGETISLADFYPARGQSRGQLSLFTGCSSKSMDARALLDSIELLRRLGFDVDIPPQQSCCGALHQHNGEPQAAEALLASQVDLLHRTDASVAILFFSPACGSSLQQIDGKRFQDVRAFVLEQWSTSSLQLTPMDHPVTLHESCSNRNMLRAGKLNQQLLALIPDIQLIPSQLPSLCCGAGGLQSFNYPEQARALGLQKLQSFDFEQASILLSDNIGCSLHMKSLLSGYNPEIEVLHPISLITRQLIDA